MDIILATVGATLAFLTFVGGQFVLKLVIEPAYGMKKTIGEISHALIAHGKIISNPEVFDKDKRDKVYEHLNALSAQLQASFYLIPKCIRKNSCLCLPRLFGFPSQDNILKASQHLQSLATCLYPSKDEDVTRFHQNITYLKRNICRSLDIFMLEEEKLAYP